ncbi:MAG: MFS transporter [Anaerolineae bacterium]
MNQLSERESRRNLALLAVDYVSYGVGVSFLGTTTVFPTLIRLLGGSPLVVGSVSAIQAGAFLLPQLFAGRHLANRPQVKGYVVATVIASRLLLSLGAPALALLALRAPAAAIAALLLSFGAFNVVDALATVGWYELLAKAIPEDRRGRIFGLGQVLVSGMGIGVGLLVRELLRRPDAFPESYVALWCLAALAAGACPFSLALVKEPARAVAGNHQPPWREYLPQLGRILRRDARFAWITLVRWLAGLADMGAAFYVLYATDRLGLPASMSGPFLSAMVAGSLACGLILGPLADRRGGVQPVIVLFMILRCLGPVLALLAPGAARVQPWLGIGLLLAVFFTAGVATGAFMLGFNNYVLHIAPATERPAYMALANTLGGLLLVAPLFAGWVVQVTSYEALFGLTLLLAVVGLGLALRAPQVAKVLPSETPAP